jgi:hypothetical protein
MMISSVRWQCYKPVSVYNKGAATTNHVRVQGAEDNLLPLDLEIRSPVDEGIFLLGALVGDIFEFIGIQMGTAEA